MSTHRERLAMVLKQARLNAGFDSQVRLAKQLNLSRPVVVRAESATQPVPSDVVLAAWAKATGVELDGLMELAQRAKSAMPEWFMPYVGAEQAATRLWFWEPMIVPGLFQTAAYARALLSDRPRAPEQLAALVEQRMERQAVIGRAEITAVIDHYVLERCVGTPAIMADQCAHVAKLVESQLISLHVVPEGGNIALTGAFAIATKDGASTVSMTASSRDITSIAADVIDENTGLFGAVLAAALPTGPSLEFVRQREAIWRQ